MITHTQQHEYLPFCVSLCLQNDACYNSDFRYKSNASLLLISLALMSLFLHLPLSSPPPPFIPFTLSLNSNKNAVVKIFQPVVILIVRRKCHLHCISNYSNKTTKTALFQPITVDFQGYAGEVKKLFGTAQL